MLEALAKLLKVLNSETQPGQISLALALSMIVGFTPVFSLHNIVVIFFVLTLRVNLSAFLLGFITFSGMAYLLDPLFNDFGRAVLTYKGLEEFWTGLYNSTFWRMTRFNNTIVIQIADSWYKQNTVNFVTSYVKNLCQQLGIIFVYM